MGITANQRETIAAIDVLPPHTPFMVKGDASTGALYVTIPGTASIGTKPAIATAASPSYSEASSVALSTDLAGNLRVTGSISVGGTTDNSAYTAGSSTGTPAMGFYHSTIDTVTDGRAATVGITNKRAMMVNLQTAAGVEITNTANALDINIKSGSIANTSFVATQSTASSLKTEAHLFDSSTNGISSTGNALDINIKSGSISNTSFIATQATAANLNATVVGTGTFAVQATLSAETTKVIGTVNIAAAQTIAVTNAGTFATQPTIQTGTNSIGKISDITASVVPGTAATNLGKAEDAAHTTADTGVFTLAVRTDTQASSSGTTGDYTAFATDSVGGLYTTPAASTGAIGSSIYFNSALSSTKQAVNASGGNLYGYHIYNPNTTVQFVQFFNVASGSVTVGSTAPTMVISVPPLGWADSISGVPIGFATAMTVAATTTSTGSGTPGTALLTDIWFK